MFISHEISRTGIYVKSSIYESLYSDISLPIFRPLDRKPKEDYNYYFVLLVTGYNCISYALPILDQARDYFINESVEIFKKDCLKKQNTSFIRLENM